MIDDVAFWESLSHKISEQRKITRRLLTSGGCADYAAYREACGQLKAFDQVADMAKEVFDQQSGRAEPPTEGSQS